MPFPDRDHSRAVRESLGEVEEILDDLDRSLARLVTAAGSGDVPPDLINGFFRGAHSLKGVAGMLGYTAVSGLAHHLESLLDLIRLGRIPLDTETLELLEAALDGLTMLVRVYGSGGSPPDMTPLLERITACCVRTVPPPSHGTPRPLLPERTAAALTEFEAHRLAETVRKGGRLFLIHASFLLESFDRELESLMDLLKSQGEVISTLPSPGRDRADAIDFDILVGGEGPPASLPSGVTVAEIEVVTEQTAPPDGEATPSAVTSPEDRPVSARSTSGTVRVDIGALDDLMALVGELVAAQSSLRDAVEQVREAAPAVVDGVVKRAELVGRKLRELQQGVMEIRLVPVRTLYDKLARIVKQIAADEGRLLKLELHGGETRLDKRIVEDISDPLMHLVRNAVDHGIETAAERRGAAKAETGRITIAASQKGNRVVIEVTDDGRGIDLDKVRRQAVARGVVRSPDGLTDREALELIFEPGFSTSDVVSELSGRGVGMDVVKSAITALSGTVSAETEPGRGSRVVMHLPVTLAIVRILIIEAGGESYGLPVSVIQETVAVTPDEMRTLEGSELLPVRELSIPVLRLDRFFGRPASPEVEPSGYAVVAGAAPRLVGIMADRIRGQHDLVLKPLGDPLAGVRGIAGAVELSDHRTVLVLDLPAMIDEVYHKGGMRAS